MPTPPTPPRVALWLCLITSSGGELSPGQDRGIHIGTLSLPPPGPGSDLKQEDSKHVLQGGPQRPSHPKSFFAEALHLQFTIHAHAGPHALRILARCHLNIQDQHWVVAPVLHGQCRRDNPAPPPSGPSASVGPAQGPATQSRWPATVSLSTPLRSCHPSPSLCPGILGAKGRTSVFLPDPRLSWCFLGTQMQLAQPCPP